MKKKYITIFIILFIISFSNIFSQQDPMYTQYMYNTLSVNPGYAGSRGGISILGLARTQWVGIKGAPDTQTLTVHSPIFDDNMGLGLSVINDRVGPIHNTMVYGDYSYSIDVTGNSRLSFGLKGGLNILKGDLISLESTTGNDPGVVNIDNKIIPNFGLGLYYYSDRGYIGLSAPKLLEHNLKTGDTHRLNKERRHYFLIGGYVFRLSESLKFKPSFLVKAVFGSPLSVDLSANFLIRDKIGLGIAHRLDDSFSGLLQYYFTPQFRIGYAYDFTMTDLRKFNSGTHELMLGYDIIHFEESRIHSPRFF